MIEGMLMENIAFRRKQLRKIFNEAFVIAKDPKRSYIVMEQQLFNEPNTTLKS